MESDDESSDDDELPESAIQDEQPDDKRRSRKSFAKVLLVVYVLPTFAGSYYSCT